MGEAAMKAKGRSWPSIDKTWASLARRNCQGGSKEHYLYFATVQHLNINTHTQSKEMLHIPA